MADAQELEMTYGLRVTPIPTALPIARRDYPDVTFKTRKGADDAMMKEVEAVGGGQPDGRPCLIGTTSVAQSESLVAKLNEKGIKAELLNASPKNAPRESEIVAQAGRAGVVTVATNMAGRGTDILLGGCPTTMSRIKTRSFLLEQEVLSAEEASKLPPSPAEDYYPGPLADEVLMMLKEAAAATKMEFGSDLTSIDLDEILTVAFDTTEAEDDPDYIVKLRDAADNIKETYGELLEKEKEAVKQSGGLYVMGTNRHESSRIDNQLRGRAGRQGDPGTSRFFLSFEDDMFVIFGGDQLQNILKMFRVSEDMPVEAQQVTDALDKVQKQVEEKYREIRKEIFKFDEVLNGQRTVIYSRRRDILSKSSKDSIELMTKYNEQTVIDIVKAQTKGGSVDVEKVLEKIGQFFPTASALVVADDLARRSPEEVTAFITVAVDEAFSVKCDDIDKKAQAAGKERYSLGRSANYITLVSMDNAWSDHLQAMENLKESVILRKYQGRDPVVEYQNESLALFKGLEDTMRFNAVYSLWQSLAATGQPSAQAA